MIVLSGKTFASLGSSTTTYEVIKELCLAQQLEALAALWYERDAHHHVRWQASLQFAAVHFDNPDHTVRRRAFHVASNICLQSTDACNRAIFECNILTLVWTHVVRFVPLFPKNTPRTSETDRRVRPLFGPVQKLLLTIASILTLDWSQERELRDRLRKAACNAPASVVTEGIAVLAQTDDTRTVLDFLCSVFVELKDNVPPSLESLVLSLYRDVSTRCDGKPVWSTFPLLCARIAGTLEDYRMEADDVKVGVSLMCVLLGVRPGCNEQRIIVGRVLQELKDEQYTVTDELLARVCFDAIVAFVGQSSVSASTFLLV